jgi:8-oxo-dGTP pyrophosphatase MutT (NUDIX family)
VFRFISNLVVAIYGRFPIFGHLRSSVAVIRNSDGRYLVIERADRRGLGFPGGLRWLWESAEATLRREVAEETGLHVESARLLFRYLDDHYVPGDISVFEAVASGELKSSWEGVPRWSTLEAIAADPFASHLEILQFLRGRTEAPGSGGGRPGSSIP